MGIRILSWNIVGKYYNFNYRLDFNKSIILLSSKDEKIIKIKTITRSCAD
jgi:hypothetical protein